MNRHRAEGSHWERVAESFLQAKGLQTIMRNFNCRLGEIDLILEDGDCLVFAEIRYRRTARFGDGAASITPMKQKRIIRAAQRFLQFQPHRTRQPCRFDVVSLGHDRGKLNVNWVRGAFTAD